MEKFSECQLRQVAQQARAEYDTIVGNCYEICHTFGNILIDLGLPHRENNLYQVFQVRVGEDGQEPHYLFKLNHKYYKKDVQKCVIDLSIDQFNNQNKRNGTIDVSIGSKSNIQPVRIYEKPAEQIDRYMTTSQYLSLDN